MTSPQKTQPQESKFGFTDFAERWNGRLAMIGFVASVVAEYVTGHSILSSLL